MAASAFSRSEGRGVERGSFSGIALRTTHVGLFDELPIVSVGEFEENDAPVERDGIENDGQAGADIVRVGLPDPRPDGALAVLGSLGGVGNENGVGRHRDEQRERICLRGQELAAGPEIRFCPINGSWFDRVGRGAGMPPRRLDRVQRLDMGECPPIHEEEARPLRP